MQNSNTKKPCGTLKLTHLLQWKLLRSTSNKYVSLISLGPFRLELSLKGFSPLRFSATLLEAFPPLSFFLCPITGAWGEAKKDNTTRQLQSYSGTGEPSSSHIPFCLAIPGGPDETYSKKKKKHLEGQGFLISHPQADWVVTKHYHFIHDWRFWPESSGVLKLPSAGTG